jgi:hypothetical protein
MPRYTSFGSFDGYAEKDEEACVKVADVGMTKSMRRGLICANWG